jgi:hypothetical protein
MTKLLPFALVALFLIFGCNPYRQVSLETNTFYNNTKVPKRIDAYDVYVHKDKHLYWLKDQTFTQDTLRGRLEEIPAASVNAHPETNAELRNSRKDIHVYLSKPVEELEMTADSTATIDRKSVERVDMFARNEKNTFSRIGLALLLAGVGALIIIALFAAAIKGSEDAANGSDSGSDSNSGDSDSGGSDSGCYVATMVYGSYDAPNVLVLRAFRDRFLQHYAWGRSFIRWYYANSPRFVEKHRNKRILGACIRFLLNGFVWIIRPFYGS